MNPHAWKTNYPDGHAPGDEEKREDDERESLYLDGDSEPREDFDL